jgi:hypothetical protein
MIREGDIVAIFNSIHRVMKAEKLLKEQRFQMLLIPVPRTLQSDCGLAIRYAESDREKIERVLGKADLLPHELYRLCAEGFVRIDI